MAAIENAMRRGSESGVFNAVAISRAAVDIPLHACYGMLNDSCHASPPFPRQAKHGAKTGAVTLAGRPVHQIDGLQLFCGSTSENGAHQRLGIRFE